MQQEKLKLYNIDMKYIRNLAKVDDNIFSVSPQAGKESRPFVGVVIICNNKEYCIPLSSPKEKHAKMKNDVDFTKIIYQDRLIGVLNFNNMIPVTKEQLLPISLKHLKTDSPADKHYKELLSNQLSFCQQNSESIIKKANKLYNLVTSGKANHALKRRCCDFAKLEDVLNKTK